MKLIILFTIIVFTAVLLVPVDDAFALTEDECLTLAGHKSSDGTLRNDAYWTVLTCETNGFDITLYPGQAMQIQNPNGGGAGNGAPFYSISGHGETGSTGTFQYSDGTNSGTVRIVNTPNVGVEIQDSDEDAEESQDVAVEEEEAPKEDTPPPKKKKVVRRKKTVGAEAN